MKMKFENPHTCKTLNATQIGKLLRKFRDDCLQYEVANLATAKKKDDVDVGQLLIGFMTGEDHMALTITDKNGSEVCRNACSDAETPLENATKKTDEVVGLSFFGFFANTFGMSF